MQPLMPARTNGETSKHYRLYPSHSLGRGRIFNGYESLAEWVSENKVVIIDGYAGVFWEDVRESLTKYFDKKSLRVNWLQMKDFLKPVAEVERIVAPFTGTVNSVWGTKCDLSLGDFYMIEEPVLADETFDVNIVIGAGAALINWDAPLIYLDLPKNELQFRMRAGAISNLGSDTPESASEMYKRFYFVDWVVLNEHKKNILDKISILTDSQWTDTINWAFAEDVKKGLSQLSQSVFRVRPWFEPGAWGGQWMKEKIKGVNKDDVNLAWSFELIVPENGLLFESDGNLLELSFDFLMFSEKKAVLGKHAARFGYDFPIRFNFLDTWNGGNLSIQCHPSLKYIQENFGETITQDETYYILDCQEGAEVFLGFQDDINPVQFRKQLECSRDSGSKIEIEDYVQCLPTKKHDLFLIPNGTIHSAGAGNLVLEISATPYIFTFKMYDWLRLDLNGKPRVINIEHAFNNLKFERKGDRVKVELVSSPQVLNEGPDWKVLHLPTHEEHFYDVHRMEFDSILEVETNNGCHVLMLVEGDSVVVRTENGTVYTFYYAETFVIPAATMKYTLTNTGSRKAKVVKAFLK